MQLNRKRQRQKRETKKKRKQKKILSSYCVPYVKINSKLIRYLNVRAKTINLLKENGGEDLYDFMLGNYFLGITPKAQSIKK